jgi:hypothetical protein
MVSDGEVPILCLHVPPSRRPRMTRMLMLRPPPLQIHAAAASLADSDDDHEVYILRIPPRPNLASSDRDDEVLMLLRPMPSCPSSTSRQT